jgi:hypothetical protein
VGTPRIAYFTAGSAGAGHLVRGVALGRALARNGEAAYRIFSPPSPFAARAAPWLETVSIDPAALRDRGRAPATALAQALAAFAPDVLVIDVFWVPLVFVPLPCPAWLLLRSVPPAWLVGPREARFDASRYERVLAIEPAPGLEPFEPWSPLVVARPDEVVPRDALCALLDEPASRPLRLVVRAGLPEDRAVLEDAARALDPGRWRTLDLADAGAPFPAARWLGALGEGDQLVAAPGYNTFWEAQTLGFARYTRWVPIRRTHDDGAMRAALHVSTPPADGADALARALLAAARR